jgi:DNA mismatch repair protein MutS
VATPRDLAALGRSLGRLPDLAAALAHAADPLATATGADGEDLLGMGQDLGGDLAQRIGKTLVEGAPASVKEGGFIRPGVSAELDELAALAAGGRGRIAAIETRERERTGIASLKVKYNSVFGYYIEITRAHLASVPADYVRKQTVANAERFVTPELSDYEATIASADERRIALEQALFAALLREVGDAADRVTALAARVAAIDALASLAEVAHRRGYVRPVVDDGDVIDLSDCRHPVVESLVAAGAFVPNDVRLDADSEQMLLVTGPNMAGKSTLIRQVALAVVLAQMGSFVPARAARIGMCDRVFTRVGAGDDLSRGESTFLVEMRETAHILRNASKKSLVILDEIGRGTSTYDGVSIAWAVAEHLHDRIGARTLFATHYHELGALADRCPRVRNVGVAAREWQGDVVFLRKLVAGGASRSFGIEVAKLAGLPGVVVERARAILGALEGERPATDGVATGPTPVAPAEGEAAQLALFAKRGANREGDGAPQIMHEVTEALRRIEPDELSPRAAWQLVHDLRKKLTKES